MGWEMPWYSITDSFDADFGVDEWHGHNVFFRDGDQVFRTYLINSRGDEAMGTIWSYLDITRARPPGDLGGLAGGLPPDPAVQVVELARQLRTPRPRPTRNGSRFPTLEKPPSESPTRRRKHDRGPSRPPNRRREP